MVDKNVKRLKTGVENEILLENNCCLEYVDSEESININGEKHKLYSLKIYSPSSCESRSRSRSKSRSGSRSRSRNSQKAKSRSANTNNVDKSNVKIKRMLEIIPSDEYDFITSPEDIPDMPDIILTPQEKLKDISEYVDPFWGGTVQLEKVFTALSKVKLKVLDIDLDFCLARGLNYYTGIIMEISSPDEMPVGSIVGGGRYDDLVNKGDKNTSGFGISFGFDRIKLIMDELNLFPESTNNSNSFLFLNFGEELSHEILKYITELRYSGIACELYPNDIKMKKQLDYANDKKIDFVVFFGLDEHKKNEFTIKDMNTGKQKSHNLSKIVDEIKKLS